MAPTVIARGTYAVVTRLMMPTGEDAVLKRANGEEDSEEHIKTEAETLTEISSDNQPASIVQFISYHAPDCLYLAYFHGSGVQDQKDNNQKFSRRQVDAIIQCLLEALAYLHHPRGNNRPVILHNDISTENVMVTARGDNPPRALLIDFGLARMYELDGVDEDGRIRDLNDAGEVVLQAWANLVAAELGQDAWNSRVLRFANAMKQNHQWDAETLYKAWRTGATPP
jgi:serine/threonine protein kinase